MNELQDRLKHLVNYSSQLIFVSGDTIAQQQRTLEDFLSLQEENTEISFIEAQAGFGPVDFRRLICRHLLDQRVGSFVRPLKELLIDLHYQQGPFLVCIKGSENIPNDFLQELWDWVVDSRKNSATQHLNIILFGESSWAERAKAWLPARNSDKPVLLSNHAVATNVNESTLQTLMAESSLSHNTHSAFKQTNRSSTLSNKWFILAVLSVLLLSFILILAWQYPNYISEFFKTGTLPEITTAQQVDTAPPEISGVQEKNTLDQNLEEANAAEIVDEETFAAEQILVTDWQQDKNKDKETTAINEMAESAEPISQETVSNQDNDFQVPDILNVEQLDAVLGNDLTSEDIVLNQSNLPTNEPTSEKVSEFEYDEAMLMALPDNAVLLQLSGIQNRSVLNSYLQTNNLKNDTWIYRTQRYGGTWFVVLYSKAFSNLDEARQESKRLPENVRLSSPFAKTASQVKEEIQLQL